MTCCGRSSVIFKVATLLLLVGFVLNAIGFASPFWSTRTADFEGLWQICAAGTCTQTVGNAATTSDWFIANQVLQTLGVVLALVAAIIAFVFLCSSCVNRCFNACGIVVAIHVLLAGVILVAGLALYGVQAKITTPGVEYLFAFWLVLVAAGLYFVSGILFSLSIDRDWRHDDTDLPN